MRLPKADCRLFLGKSSSGKSTLARFQAKPFSRVLWHDPNGENEAAEGAVICSDRRYLLDLLRAKGPMRICWRGGIEDLDGFEWANEAVWAAGDFLVVWDEVDRFTGSGKLPPWAFKIITAGRHQGLRVFACSRRPFRVSRDLSGAATTICAFRTTEPRDLRYFADYCGKAAENIPTLPDYHCLVWTEQTSEIKKSPFR